MRVLATFLIVLSATLAEECRSILECDRYDNGRTGEPLFVTQLLERQDGQAARKASRVLGLGDKVESYSGMLTVNQKHDSNVFFWFFPASDADRTTAPVIVWIEGRPGSSVLESIFNLNGPYYVDSRMNLRVREQSWSKNFSMLYFDSPVGSGFSYTGSEEGLATTQDEVADNLLVAIKQFLQTFPEYEKNEMYLGGEFYAGKIVPVLGQKMIKANKAPDVNINLRGIIIGNGLTDPASVMDLSDNLYQRGYLGYNDRLHFRLEGEKIMMKIHQGKLSDAFQDMDSLFGGIIEKQTYFSKVTGLEGLHSLTRRQNPDIELLYKHFSKAPCARRSIHVGDLQFDAMNETVVNYLRGDYLKSAKIYLETLLNRGNVSALFYTRSDQVLAVPYSNTVHFLSHLHWSRTPGFLQATRTILRKGENVVGYVTDLKDLRHVVFTDAGTTDADFSELTLDAVTQFIRSKSKP